MPEEGVRVHHLAAIAIGTRFSIMESTLGKWVELLKELAPHVTHVAFMFNPETAPVAIEPATYVQAAAPKLAIEAVVAQVRELADIDSVMTSLASRPGGGLIIPADSYTKVNRKLVLDLAARNGCPRSIPRVLTWPTAALLPMASMPSIRPGRPPDMSIGYCVQQPTKFELVINMKTVKAATADELIE